ncbi:MAG: hypothetical protein ABGW88_07045 [Leeuwenhoekiella sp.]|uniref:hypothetical protein n=2 Tax=unclassified Leeuwenhoekiella TaxID=2615029 RepID=UPI0032425FE6|tara:strand:+ start:2366 stop:3055 length:690 start_codon:yes stop_codon:yes gene_type:complete
MEQSKHSEEEIIKLGEKIVKELDLEYSVNTLARWMSHYIAELIQNIEDADSESEKKVLKKECCDLILHIWSQKNILPIRQPLDDLKPLVEILEVLNEEKKINVAPRWLEYNSLPRNNEWATFIDTVKNNSEKIFNKVVEVNIHKDILIKDEEWMKNNKAFLNKEEIRFFQIIDVLNKTKIENGVLDWNNYEMSDDNKERVENIFFELESLIEEQRKQLLKIKSNFFTKD